MSGVAEQQARLEKIRALLAKAEGTHFPEEAKVFASKAQELMSKWAIDEAMLGEAENLRGDIIAHDLRIDANEYRAPKVRLVANLCDINDCKSVIYPQYYDVVEGRRKRVFRVQLVGHKADVEFVVMLYTSLLLQAEQELLSPKVLASAQAECTHGGHHIRWRNTFMMSYAATIWYRLRDAKRAAERQAQDQYAAQGSKLALVLVGRMALVERKFAELHPRLGKAKSTSAGQGFGSASAHGTQAGNRADIGKPKMDGRGRGQTGGGQ